MPRGCHQYEDKAKTLQPAWLFNPNCERCCRSSLSRGPMGFLSVPSLSLSQSPHLRVTPPYCSCLVWPASLPHTQSHTHCPPPITAVSCVLHLIQFPDFYFRFLSHFPSFLVIVPTLLLLSPLPRPLAKLTRGHIRETGLGGSQRDLPIPQSWQTPLLNFSFSAINASPSATWVCPPHPYSGVPIPGCTLDSPGSYARAAPQNSDARH